MKKKTTPPVSFAERIRRIKAAGLQTERLQGTMDGSERLLPDLAVRVALIEAFAGGGKTLNIQSAGMLFFIMYDIEDHKIRRHLAKYLQKQGCERMQKSVFLGNTSHQTYREMAETLREINSMYHNGDSIMILPITKESMTQLNVIGKNLSYEMHISPPHVLII